MTTTAGVPPTPEEKRVGRYRLLTVIGEGGMGVVHLAEDPNGHRVALKVLRPHIVGDLEARERLAREVGSLSRIRSPRVAEILDADPHGPVPFVATRYVPGLSLHQHVREYGPMSEDDLLLLAEGLADALLAVHRVGVLHRDVKPSNVLMEGRSPVLIDFGLARLAEDPRLTATGWLLGTPGYLAPEVLYGDEATPASDVHALAATVVFAATGSAPYGRGPAMAIMDRVRRGEHDLSGVPASMAPMLAEALSPDPLERPPLVELHRELRRRLDAANAPPATPPAGPAPEQWTVPLAVAHARERSQAGEQPTDVIASSAPVEEPATEVIPANLPYEEPPPPAPEPPPAHEERVRGPLREPEDAPFVQPLPAEVNRAKQRLVTLGVAAAATAVVAAAPYTGAAVVAALVALLRLASVTSERHARRRELRGRSRWYDVPASALATPGYLLISLAGTVVLVGWAVAVACATAVLMALSHVPLTAGLLAVGAAYVASSWWGPGSPRVRGVTRKVSERFAGDSATGWVVLALSLVLTATLVGLMASSGPSWSPQTSAPWSKGFVAELSGLL